MSRVVADHVEQRGRGAARVVQIGDAVAETGAQVHEGHGRSAAHTPETVGGAGTHTLEQTQHRAKRRCAIDALHQVHLGRAGIGEAHLHAGRHEPIDE